MKKNYISMLLFALLSAFGVSAFAVPPDYTALTSLVDFNTVITALLAVFGGLAGLYVVWKGGNMILGAIRK